MDVFPDFLSPLGEIWCVRSGTSPTHCTPLSKLTALPLGDGRGAGCLAW